MSSSRAGIQIGHGLLLGLHLPGDHLVLAHNGGLMPIAMGAQVRIKDGQLSVVDGPFVEAKEVIGGYAIFELRDKEEAVASAKEFMQLHKDLMPGWKGRASFACLPALEARG